MRSASNPSPRGAHESQLDGYRHELTGFCYRMMGSASDADDAVQETMIRAWRGLHRFEGRSTLRSWLYRIATNVCFDQLNGRRRRAQPMDLNGPTSLADAAVGAPRDEATWIQPIPDGRVLPSSHDPGEVAVERESIRLAFVAALQHLPARQRAVLILRDVLRWKATEVADLLGTTVVSVNSALQRARAAIAASDITADEASDVDDDAQQELIDRYVDAFERYDIDELVTLLHDDATLSMPPYELWLQGTADIAGWYAGHGAGCRGSRLIPTAANGSPAFGQYRPGSDGASHEAFSLQVLDESGGRIRAIHTFLDTATLFPLFELPTRLAEGEVVASEHLTEPGEDEEVA